MRPVDYHVNVCTADNLPHSYTGDSSYDTVRAWGSELLRHDPELYAHCQRVSVLAGQLARAMNLKHSQVQAIEWGAFLHDIGKIYVPRAILDKPGRLTEAEKAWVNRHPCYGEQIVMSHGWLPQMPAFRTIHDIVLYHHEQWTGGGYPFGLRKAEIPLAARICAIVDVWDAMRTDRPYHAGQSPYEVAAHIARSAGSHFDPVITHMFLQLVAPMTCPAEPAHTATLQVGAGQSDELSYARLSRFGPQVRI